MPVEDSAIEASADLTAVDAAFGGYRLAHGTATAMRLFHRHQILEGFVSFPAVSPEIPLIRREYTAVPQMLGKNDQRRIGEIHRQVRVLFHVPLNTCAVVAGEIEYVEGAVAEGFDQFLLRRTA